MEDLLRAADVDSGVEVTVERSTGKTVYESAAETAEGLPTMDLSNLKDIKLHGGRYSSLVIDVYFFEFATKLKVEATGDHHIKAAGVGADLIAEIDRGNRSVPRHRAITTGLWAAFLLLEAGQIVARAVSDSDTAADLLSTAAVVPILPIVWFSIFRGMFVPAREIVAEGQPGRAERWGRPLLRFGGWLATLALGGLIGVVFTNWLG